MLQDQLLNMHALNKILLSYFSSTGDKTQAPEKFLPSQRKETGAMKTQRAITAIYQ